MINLEKVPGPNQKVDAYIDELKSAPKIAPQIVHHRLMPGAPADYAQSRLSWPTAMAELIRSRGIRLYSHQALATDHIRAGHSVVAATPTASGKSLIYNLPVLERHLIDPEARALYLFPLKALAQDQLAAFNSLCLPWPKDARPTAALYDGDTTDHFRRKIRNDPPTALITNPEMLHLSILPYHERWAPFLANLSHVIVDEAHTYRGVFGSHMAQVFRRLNRIAALYGARPNYIFCTATLGNPRELAQTLMGAEDMDAPVLVNKSGAPQGARHFMFINPEGAATTCAIDLLKRALENNLRCIVYCQSRRIAELVSLWAGSQSGPYKNKISSYRAGFLPEERRDIERRMASGELLAVVSTSALELGIDIGGLDVCILVGYPGTVMQTLQRGGRVGRAMQNSAVILVAGEDAMDQYFMRHPDDFFSRPPEKAVVNPANDVIRARHLECAAAELPLEVNEPWVAAAASAIASLRAEGRLLQSADGSQWLATRKSPQRNVDLRGSGSSYTIEDSEGTVIGLLDGFRAWKETHPGAVYLHHGKSYVIEDIDEGRMRVMAKTAKVEWFTRTRGNKATDILEEYGRFSLGRCLVGRGRLRITEKITGYEKRSVSGNRLLTITPLKAPPQIFETEGMWFVIPDNIRAGLEERFIHFMGSIHALEHAVIGLLPLEVMADRNDFGGISTPLHAQLGLPAVFVYDGLPGGAGLCAAAYPEARRILQQTLRAVADCPCESGCPSCVHSPKCGAGNRPISKAGAVALLTELLAPGDEGGKLLEALSVSPAPDRIAPKFPQENLTSAVAEKPEKGFAEPRQAEPIPPAFLSSAPYVAAPPPENYVVFDVETRRSAADVGGWENAADMGVSVAALYDSRKDEFFTYSQDELPELLRRMAEASLVVGFNSSRFDYEVLRPFASLLDKPLSLPSLPTLDLLSRIKSRLNYRVSLDNLGRATLNSPKSADGLQALRWWKEGKIAKIAEYCQKDVEITRDIYLYGLKNGYVLFTNKAGKSARVDVDFKR